jgi:hypothetical protein
MAHAEGRVDGLDAELMDGKRLIKKIKADPH